VTLLQMLANKTGLSVFTKAPGSDVEQLRGDLHGRWRQTTRAVMVPLSLRGLPVAQIAVLLDCHPATVRHWTSTCDMRWPTRGRPECTLVGPALF
jgi:hypothetical protein